MVEGGNRKAGNNYANGQRCTGMLGYGFPFVHSAIVSNAPACVRSRVWFVLLKIALNHEIVSFFSFSPNVVRSVL